MLWWAITCLIQTYWHRLVNSSLLNSTWYFTNNFKFTYIKIKKKQKSQILHDGQITLTYAKTQRERENKNK